MRGNAAERLIVKCVSAVDTSYIDARATIKRTSMPFQYRLCVERIYEEGEDTLEAQGTKDGNLGPIPGVIVYSSISYIATF